MKFASDFTRAKWIVTSGFDSLLGKKLVKRPFLLTFLWLPRIVIQILDSGIIGGCVTLVLRSILRWVAGIHHAGRIFEPVLSAVITKAKLLGAPDRIFPHLHHLEPISIHWAQLHCFFFSEFLVRALQVNDDLVIGILGGAVLFVIREILRRMFGLTQRKQKLRSL